MAVYEIELEDGGVYQIETDDSTKVKPSVEPQNKMGMFINVPGAAVRSALQGTGYAQGAMNPSKVPTFSNQFQNKVSDIASNIPNPAVRDYAAFMGAQAVQPVGAVADYVTNPADLALALAPMVPGVKQAAGAVGKAVKPAVDALGNTKAVQAVSRFLNKDRRFLKFGKDAVLDISKKGVAGFDKLDDLAGAKYEEGIKSIKGKSNNIQGITKEIDDAFDTYPSESFPVLKRIKNNLSDKTELSAEELRNLKMEAKRGIPRGVFQNKVDPTSQQYAQLKVYNAIDDELVSLGGDKYKAMKTEYSEWKNTASDAYRALLEEGRAGDKNLRNWFGYGLSRRQTKALEKGNFMLPKGEQFMQDFYAWRRGQMAKGLGGAALPITYLLHRAMAEKVMGDR